MVEQNGPAPLVEVEGMVKSFGENAVLRDVSLALRRSDVMAVVGGNGAGKSTLMKILAGIYTPDKGSIRIEGSDVSLHTPSAAHAMGVYLVPQEPLLFPNMTVEENLSLGLDEPRTDVRKRAVALIKRLNWPLSMSRQANSLSIAEQQLVEIL
ncbi:MAG TPA: ATP-binding cassette domain-containing protein, partial [Synergistales bacterium]|nr:ATP-binding cassette domain-containing protein [Synergistales bacterium]